MHVATRVTFFDRLSLFVLVYCFGLIFALNIFAVFKMLFHIVYCLLRNLVQSILLLRIPFLKRCSCFLEFSRCQFRSAVQIL